MPSQQCIQAKRKKKHKKGTFLLLYVVVEELRGVATATAMGVQTTHDDADGWR